MSDVRRDVEIHNHKLRPICCRVEKRHIASGYPLHRENRENGKKYPCQVKRRKFVNFGKTQGIRFAHVVNSLIQKVKDILKFAAKIFKLFLKLDKLAKSQIT